MAQFFGAGAIMIGGNSFMRAACSSGRRFQYRYSVLRRRHRYGKTIDESRKSHIQPSSHYKDSARRFKKEGILNLEFKYLISFIKGPFFLERKKERNAEDRSIDETCDDVSS